MKLLALDSSGLVASAAVVEDDVTIAEYTVNHKKTHSQTLLPMLDELKRMTELDLHTVDAIAIAAGPGSFTGLRIGSATAKGLGLALDIPIIPVPTVDALAYNFYGSDKLICPLMDARRNQVYTGLYTFQKGSGIDSGYDMCVVKKQCAVEISRIVEWINESGQTSDYNDYNKEVLFLGDGAAVYKDKIAELIKVKYSFAPASCNRQRASCVAALGLVLYKNGIKQTAAEHAPDYLRLSQAERERAEQSKDQSKASKTPLKYHIREIDQKDLEEVAALEASCFSMPWKYKDFEDVLTNPDRFYLVAEADEVTADTPDRILGGCMLTHIVGEGDISNVAVLEKYRKNGVGAALVTELLKLGAERYGITAYTLEVRSKNMPARRLYEKHGFVSRGVRPDFYQKPKDDAVIMWKM